jgi:glycogen debranching enzyme
MPNDAGKEIDYPATVFASLTERALRNLKHGDAFAVLDAHGDTGALADMPEGLFYRDTRYLSHFLLTLNGRRPLLLSSDNHEDKTALSVDLTNPAIDAGADSLPKDAIFLLRTKFLWQAVLYERLCLRNYDSEPRSFRIDFGFNADFKDLFEVRGLDRSRRGRVEAGATGDARSEFRYQGLDGLNRRVIIRFNPRPDIITFNSAGYAISLRPGEQQSIFVAAICEEEGEGNTAQPFFRAYRQTRRARRASTSAIATVESSNESFNEVVSRSASDLYMLITRSDLGPYPYAGIPWYSTIFGRDGIITAIMMLWMDPDVARGVLLTLARMQAAAVDPQSDAQPGKILHERRRGEMALLGEVPFRFYYGSVDATPLYVILAGLYYDRTGDADLIDAIWPNIESALGWIENYGDQDGDGFVEYHKESERGLDNQGWKDSRDAVFHADGALARGPIALCEVQGYVYAAKHAAARLARARGQTALARKLTGEAIRLRDRFNEAFWCEELGSYALALDGEKRQCRVYASNAGHALFCGIAPNHRARAVARLLMSAEGFSGWGIRTIRRGEARYNPMSYHNGSVWPHDNALIALGFARYGLKQEAVRVFEALFTAATYQDLRRLPELFCGFQRKPHRGPTAYPVACSPQAWASAAPFALLQACLGLDLRHEQHEIRFSSPVLPPFLDEILLRNLRIGDACVDLRVARYGQDAAVNVLRRRGDIRVVVAK